MIFTFLIYLYKNDFLYIWKNNINYDYNQFIKKQINYNPYYFT
jgi:hypothetical protein